MTETVELIHSRVIGIFVRNEESRFDVTAVGVHSLPVEQFTVQPDVVVVDCVIKTDGDLMERKGNR